MVTGVALPHAKHRGAADPYPHSLRLIYLSTSRLAPGSPAAPFPLPPAEGPGSLIPRAAGHSGGSYSGHAL